MHKPLLRVLWKLFNMLYFLQLPSKLAQKGWECNYSSKVETAEPPFSPGNTKWRRTRVLREGLDARGGEPCNGRPRRLLGRTGQRHPGPRWRLGRGQGRGARRGKAADKERNPAATSGRLVKAMKTKSLEEIWRSASLLCPSKNLRSLTFSWGRPSRARF